MTLTNRNLMGAKHVADITRSVIAGPGGRVSKKVESLTDNEVIESVRSFLDVISIAFTALAEITEEDVDNYDPSLSEKKKNEPPAPPNLREDGAEDGDIQEFFKRLDRHMTAPVTEDSIWRTTTANEDFEPNASAPIMRQQNVVHLTKVITDWYKKAPAAI
jgi:hypothetical protein